MTSLWSAPTAVGPVRAVVEVPGSKSITNRALILAALAEGPSVITGGLLARDTALMIDALRSLGTGIEVLPQRWRIAPGALHGPVEIDCGLAGTIMRFLPPLACLASGPVRMDGDPRARERPMGPLLGALHSLGARIDATDGRLPLTIHGTGGLRGGATTIDAAASSQFISGLLLSGPRFDEGLDVSSSGTVPSLPHLEMSAAMLREQAGELVGIVTDLAGENAMQKSVQHSPASSQRGSGVRGPSSHDAAAAEIISMASRARHLRGKPPSAALERGDAKATSSDDDFEAFVGGGKR